MAFSALVHTHRHSIASIEAAFAWLWLQPLLMNLRGDSLSVVFERDGGLTPAMAYGFLGLSHHTAATGCDSKLLTCSDGDPCVEVVKARCPGAPVLKPSETTIPDAITAGRTRGLVAASAAPLRSMLQEFLAGTTIRTALAEDALAPLDRDASARRDEIAARTAVKIADCDVIALAQFSLARAAPMVAGRTGEPTLTTPDSAGALLNQRIAGAD